MSDMSMVQRIVARYAGRIFNFPPVKLDKCKHCGGSGIDEDKTHSIKHTCIRCLGTGTDPDDVKTLRDVVDEITEVIRVKKVEFDKIKKRYMGRGSRQLGMMGRDLQTLNGALKDREEKLKPELARWEVAQVAAREVGASGAKGLK